MISLVACVFLICLTLLLRESLRNMHAQKSAPPSHPCPFGHDATVVDVRPYAVENTINKHVILLCRCKRCGNQYSSVMPGEWTTGDFLKTQPDSEWFKREVG